MAVRKTVVAFRHTASLERRRVPVGALVRGLGGVDAELGFVDGPFLAYPVGVVGISGVLTGRHHQPTVRFRCRAAGNHEFFGGGGHVRKNSSPPGLVV